MKRVLVTGIELIVDVPDHWDKGQVMDYVGDAKKEIEESDHPVTILGANEIRDSDIVEIAE